MKRLLLPISVFIAVLAAVILFQPSQALNALPEGSSSEDLRAQSALDDFHLLGLPDPAWYDLAWAVRRPVTIANSGSALTNHQVLVSLGSSFDYSHAQANGADLRVTDADGTTLLPFWIESWNTTSHNSWVWVKVPSLPSGDTVIYLYYGNSSAAAASDGEATFEVYDGFEAYTVGSTPKGVLTNPGEWTRYASNPVLTPGPAAWDAVHATFASVITDTTVGEYRMYYHGINASGVDRIGLVTSSNGITWIKYPGNPVLTVGASGAWDDGGVRVPMVWKEGPTDYRMIYTGSHYSPTLGVTIMQAGYATSTNGIDWNKSTDNPVFNDPNAWAHNSTENWGVIKVGAEYLMWYGDLSAPRESSIATSTNLITWTPYTSAPIFATSGVGSDQTYSQFCPFTFKYGGYYYVLVPSYTSVGNYSRYYLYRSSSPYFPTGDRHLVRVVHTPGASGQWDEQDADTPMVFTSDIERSVFPGNRLWTYYAGASETGGIWREGMLIEPDISTALADSELPYSILSWTASGAVTVVDSPVRQGLRSLRLNDPSSSGSTTMRGNFAAIGRGSIGAWMRRDNTTAGDFDIYLYENSTLAAVAGLGRSPMFHYWNGGYQNTAVNWAVDTWYLVTLNFDTATDRYDFVVYNQNLVEIVRETGIAFGNAVTNINAAVLYTSSGFVGNGYADDYRLRKKPSPAPTVSVGAADPIVDLAISKAAHAGTVYLGNRLTYTISIQNTSLYAAPDVIVTDTLPAEVSLVSAVPSKGTCPPGIPGSPVTCALGEVAGGGSASIRIVVTTVASGNALNSAEVSTPAVEFNTSDNTDDVTTTILPAVDLSVTKVDNSDPVWAGSPLSYTITVHNSGPIVADNVRITDTLPSGLTFASYVSEQGDCTPGSPITCNLGDIAAGQNVKVTLFVSTTINGAFTNMVAVGSDTRDRAPGNNSDSETTTVKPAADLGVSQVDEPDPVKASHSLTYTITVHNNGPSSSAGVTLTDILPEGVVYESAEPDIYCHGSGPVVCDLPGLPASGSTQVLVKVMTTLEGLLTNTVTVASTTHDRNLVNNTNEEVTVVATKADVSITQEDTPDPVIAEQELTYILTVHNAGPSIAAFVRLTDSLPAEVTLVSATPDQGSCSPGSVVTCDLSYLRSGASAEVEVVVIPQVKGSITNIVEVSTATFEENLANNTDIETTTVLPLSADLQLSLTDAPDPVMAGELLIYTAQVANLGPSRAIDTSVSIDLSSEVSFVDSTPSCSEIGGVFTCSLGEIAASHSAAVTLTVQVSPSTFDLHITSDADASSLVADPSPANNHASATTKVDRSADLAIDILDTPDPVAPGKILTYTLVYTNSGPSDAINLVLTDHLPADVVYIRAYPAVCVHSPGTHIATCSPSDLEAGHSAQIMLVVSVKQAAEQLLDSNVEIVSETTDPNDENNVSEETTIVDSGIPSLSWVDPVSDEEIYIIMIRPGLEITLTVIATDNYGIDRVRFTRWDHVREEWVEIGVDDEGVSDVYEYVWVFDNSLELPNSMNAVFAYAYDIAGNSVRKRIWLVPNYTLLPMIMR